VLALSSRNCRFQAQSSSLGISKRLEEKGKPHKLVLVAVARKIFVIANKLVAKEELWKAV